jgi:hypothetical protein
VEAAASARGPERASAIQVAPRRSSGRIGLALGPDVNPSDKSRSGRGSGRLGRADSWWIERGLRGSPRSRGPLRPAKPRFCPSQ